MPHFRWLATPRKYHYQLTLHTHRRAHAFDCPYTVGRTLSEVLRLTTRTHVAVLAYCFMPDHLLLLVQGLEGASQLHTFVTLSKDRSGFAYARMSGQVLWQDGYHAHRLADTADPRLVAKRLLETPVRAGLVRSPTHYPHLGVAAWPIADVLALRPPSAPSGDGH